MRRLLTIVVLAVVAASRNAAAQPADFTWSGNVAPGRTIEIKGVNGAVRAELAAGSQVEVRAEKRARRSDPASVTIETVEHDGNVTICAVYPNASLRTNATRNRCTPGSGGSMNADNNDVAVSFIVRVPAGVRFAGRTVNGTIDARELQGDVDASSVNGRISVSTSGVARAETVNGAIDVTLGAAVWTEPLRFKTVNGSIDVRMPSGVDANIRADTLNGRFSSDLPVAITSSRQRGQRIVGTIGNGGRELELQTVNGSIRLHAAR